MYKKRFDVLFLSFITDSLPFWTLDATWNKPPYVFADQISRRKQVMCFDKYHTEGNI